MSTLAEAFWSDCLHARSWSGRSRACAACLRACTTTTASAAASLTPGMRRGRSGRSPASPLHSQHCTEDRHTMLQQAAPHAHAQTECCELSCTNYMLGLMCVHHQRLACRGRAVDAHRRALSTASTAQSSARPCCSRLCCMCMHRLSHAGSAARLACPVRHDVRGYCRDG